MKKLILFFGVLCCCSTLSAQNPVRLTYLSPENDSERALMEYQGIERLAAVLSGDIQMKLLTVTRYECREGEVTAETWGDHAFLSPDTTLTFWIFKEHPGDSVKMGIVPMPQSRAPLYFNLPDPGPNYILMETYSDDDWEVTDEIPFLAYTSGIHSKVRHGDESFDRYDYCLLRDKHLHPAEWYEKEGVKHYYYFTVKLKDFSF